jgi:TRAP-type mannitol/chloroaromatic compound transport system permease large subunit
MSELRGRLRTAWHVLCGMTGDQIFATVVLGLIVGGLIAGCCLAIAHGAVAAGIIGLGFPAMIIYAARSNR